MDRRQSFERKRENFFFHQSFDRRFLEDNEISKQPGSSKLVASLFNFFRGKKIERNVEELFFSIITLLRNRWDNGGRVESPFHDNEYVIIPGRPLK